MARDHSKQFWEIYEKLMSQADGIDRYILKIDSGLKARIEKDSKDHKESLDQMLTNLNKYGNPQFWRINDTVKGGDHTGNVGSTAKGTVINKTSSTQGDRIYLIRYSDKSTGKTYVMLVGYQLKHERDIDWRVEVRDIKARHGGEEYEEEQVFDPEQPIPFDDHLLDWGAIYNVLEPGTIELTQNKKELLLNEANITITMEQFRNIARTPPLLIDGHAGTGKSIIIALRIAFQYYVHHHGTKNDINTPRLLVVAYSQRVLNMIERYTTYWMERLLEYPEQYLDQIEYVPTLKLYHSLVKEVDYNSIPDPMTLQSARIFVNFFKFQNEFFQDIEYDSISAEQAWHFIRGILKGQGFGWHGWNNNKSIQIDDFASITIGGKIPRKLTHRMSRELIEKLLSIFERYESWRMNNGYIDDIDLIRKVFTAIKAKEEIERPKNDYLIGSFDNVLIDEAQDLTSKEFELLTHLLNSPAPRIVVGGDPLQTINPTGFSWTSLESFLYEKTEEGGLRKAERMLVSHRLPQKLVEFSNVIIEARSNAKNEPIKLMESAQKIKNDGFVARVIFDEKIESDVKIIEEIMMDALNSNVGILLWARDFSELDAIAENDIILGEHDLTPRTDSAESFIFDVHSIESVKGLEYESIILYRFGDLDSEFNVMSEKSLRENVEDDTKNTYPILYHLNRLFIAASRAKKNIYIIDSEESLKKSWNDVLWKNKIPVELNVSDFKEHINTEPSLEKAEIYFEKGKDEKDLNLLRKALASAMKCEISEKQKKLVTQIRIVLIDLRIILAGDEDKDLVKGLRLQLIDLYEQTENLLEATKMRALLEQWDDIRKTCKGKDAPDLKLIWNISSLDEKYPKSLEQLSWVLSHTNIWQAFSKGIDSTLRKVLRKRIRFFAKESLPQLKSEQIKKLQTNFNLSDDEVLELLSPQWDSSNSARSLKNNTEIKEKYVEMMEAIFEKNVTKLSNRGQIAYDNSLLENPNITAEASDRLIESLAKKGDKKGLKKYIIQLFESKEKFDPMDSIWPKILKTLVDMDEENIKDKNLLVKRLEHLENIRGAVFDSEKKFIVEKKWNLAVESFAYLSQNPSISVEDEGLSSSASGMKIFFNQGSIWDKTHQIIDLKPHLNLLAKKLISSLKTSGKMKVLYTREPQEYLEKILQIFPHYCDTEIIDLIERVFAQWDRAAMYNSQSLLKMIGHITLKRKQKIRKSVDFIKQIETFLLVSESFSVFYKDRNIVAKWIYERFKPENKQHAQFNIAFGRWKDGREMPKGFNVQEQFEEAKKYGDQHVIQSYANELDLNETEMTDMAIKTMNFEKISQLDSSLVIKTVNQLETELIQREIEWKNSRWFTSQSTAIANDTFNGYLQTVEDVSRQFLVSALYSNSFTQSFLSIYKFDFTPNSELPEWALGILQHGHAKFEMIAENQSAKAYFWELVGARDSFLDAIKIRKRSRYENVHFAMLACLETIFVFKKMNVKERIQYLQALGIDIPANTKKAKVSEILLQQPFMELSFNDIKENEFDRSEELYESVKSLLD